MRFSCRAGDETKFEKIASPARAKNRSCSRGLTVSIFFFNGLVPCLDARHVSISYTWPTSQPSTLTRQDLFIKRLHWEIQDTRSCGKLGHEYSVIAVSSVPLYFLILKQGFRHRRSQYSIGKIAILWNTRFLSEMVRIIFKQSHPKLVKCGGLWGSILGPLLCLLYQKLIRVETCNERSQLPNIQCELIG